MNKYRARLTTTIGLIVCVGLLFANSTRAQVEPPKVIRGASGVEYRVERRSIEVVAAPTGSETFYVVRIPVDDLSNIAKLEALVQDVRAPFQVEAEQAKLNRLAILAVVGNNFGVAQFEKRYGFVFIRGLDGNWTLYQSKKKGS